MKNKILIEMCERCDGYTPLSYNTNTGKYELCDIQDVEYILDEETRNLISENWDTHINEWKINEDLLTPWW